MTLLTQYPEQSNSQRQSNGSCQGFGQWERWGMLFNGYAVSVWDDERVVEMDSIDGCITM